jgi:hypothetical protein
MADYRIDLKIAKELVYDKCGFNLTDPKLNTESLEYGACSFALNGLTIQHRVSKSGKIIELKLHRQKLDSL